MVNITDINTTVHYDHLICNITPDISDQSNSGHPLQLEQDFSIVHHNVNRLYNKLYEIKLYLKMHYSVTIYCCSETCSRRKDLEHDIVEAVWLEIPLKHKNILLAVTYRPPNEHTVSYNTWLNYIDEAISSAYVEDKSIIILGDFNIDLLGKHPHQESWLSVIDNYELLNLSQIIPESLQLKNHYLTIFMYQKTF